MSGYLLKPADQDTTASIDWREGYLKPGEHVDGDLGWAILTTGPGEAPSVTQQSFDADRSWARISAGVPGAVHMLVVRAVTNLGRELERSIVLRIAA